MRERHWFKDRFGNCIGSEQDGRYYDQHGRCLGQRNSGGFYSDSHGRCIGRDKRDSYYNSRGEYTNTPGGTGTATTMTGTGIRPAIRPTAHIEIRTAAQPITTAAEVERCSASSRGFSIVDNP